MTLTSFNIIELSTFCVSVLGGIAMLLAQTQKSKCRNLKCCCGLIVCDRVVGEDNEEQVLEEEKIDITVDDDADESKTQAPPTLNIPVPKIVNKIPISQTKV